MTTTQPSTGAEVRTLNHWIGGKSVRPSTEQYLDRENPADHTFVSRVALGTSADMDAAAAAAIAALPEWRAKKPIERGRILLAVAERIRAHADELVVLECAETGKPSKAAGPEIASAAAYFEYYGTLVNLPAGDVTDLGPDYHIYSVWEPFGLIGVITPWNVPIPQIARACAPALAAGNVVISKPSEFTSSTAVRVAELATEAGVPDGVFNVLLGLGPEAGQALVTHPMVRKVSFTGSVAAGKTIGKLAAERVIPLTLELGGKSANVVFEDADLAIAAERSVSAFTANCGQVCSAGTRLLVQASVHDAFVEKLTQVAEGLDLRTQVGPIITDAQLEKVTSYFDVAKTEGVTQAAGGTLPADESLSEGNFVKPTIYTGVTNDMRIAQEEIFGPVVVVIPFEDEDEAIRIANDSPYGLIAGVWTRDISRAIRVSAALEVGQVFVNTWSPGAVEVAFGGYKLSGYGREKGIEGLRHYQQLKTVTVAV